MVGGPSAVCDHVPRLAALRELDVSRCRYMYTFMQQLSCVFRNDVVRKRSPRMTDDVVCILLRHKLTCHWPQSRRRLSSDVRYQPCGTDPSRRRRRTKLPFRNFAIASVLSSIVHFAYHELSILSCCPSTYRTTSSFFQLVLRSMPTKVRVCPRTRPFVHHVVFHGHMQS